jgi:hypothetical protein
LFFHQHLPLSTSARPRPRAVDLIRAGDIAV